jgi:hypothetical protein
MLQRESVRPSIPAQFAQSTQQQPQSESSSVSQAMVNTILAHTHAVLGVKPRQPRADGTFDPEMSDQSDSDHVDAAVSAISTLACGDETVKSPNRAAELALALTSAALPHLTAVGDPALAPVLSDPARAPSSFELLSLLQNGMEQSLAAIGKRLVSASLEFAVPLAYLDLLHFCTIMLDPELAATFPPALSATLDAEAPLLPPPVMSSPLADNPINAALLASVLGTPRPAAALAAVCRLPPSEIALERHRRLVSGTLRCCVVYTVAERVPPAQSAFLLDKTPLQLQILQPHMPMALAISQTACDNLSSSSGIILGVLRARHLMEASMAPVFPEGSCAQAIASMAQARISAPAHHDGPVRTFSADLVSPLVARLSLLRFTALQVIGAVHGYLQADAVMAPHAAFASAVRALLGPDAPTPTLTTLTRLHKLHDAFTTAVYTRCSLGNAANLGCLRRLLAACDALSAAMAQVSTASASRMPRALVDLRQSQLDFEATARALTRTVQASVDGGLTFLSGLTVRLSANLSVVFPEAVK